MHIDIFGVERFICTHLEYRDVVQPQQVLVCLLVGKESFLLNGVCLVCVIPNEGFAMCYTNHTRNEWKSYLNLVWKKYHHIFQRTSFGIIIMFDACIAIFAHPDLISRKSISSTVSAVQRLVFISSPEQGSSTKQLAHISHRTLVVELDQN